MSAGSQSPPGSPGSAYPASSMSNPNRPRRKRGVSVVSGLGKDHVYTGNLEGDWDPDRDRPYGGLDGSQSQLTSEGTVTGRRKKDPVGLKKRDYSFLAYHHAEDADKFDDLIAKHKGVSKNMLAADVDAEEIRIFLKSLPKDKLLEILKTDIAARTKAQAGIPETVFLIDDTVKRNERALEESKPAATEVRERQLEIQLKTIELQKANVILKQKLQMETKKLRDAKETFKAHVEGLEDSWEAYLDERKQERTQTTEARDRRIEQYKEHIKKLQDKRDEVAAEIQKLTAKQQEHLDTITTQARHIAKLSNALGIENDHPMPKRAGVSNVYPYDQHSSVSYSTSRSCTTCSTSYTSSYSSSHCSTCGETLASTYMTESETWSETESSYSDTYTATASVATRDTLESVLTERRVGRKEKEVSVVQTVTAGDQPRSVVVEGDGPAQHYEKRRTKRRSSGQNPNLLKMVHTVLTDVNLNDPKQLEAFLPDERRRPEAAEYRTTHTHERAQHPERGFNFPFVPV